MSKQVILTPEIRESCKDELNSMTDAAFASGRAEGLKDVAEALKTEHAAGVAEGQLAGSIAERERIQAVEAASLPGHEALSQTLKFDGQTSGPEAAQAVLTAEKQVRERRLAGLKADAPLPVADAVAPPAPEAVEATLPLEERAKLAWDREPDLRDEFTGFGAYLAYRKAEAAGNVRILTKTQQ
jgi:hypothetical protein